MLITNTAFLRAMRRETKRSHVKNQPNELYGEDHEKSWDIGTDSQGFYTATHRELGKLCGLLFVQVQCDGASRMQIHYTSERMVYTIGNVDYDMVPPPAPLNSNLCRYLAIASKLEISCVGRLEVPFADLALILEVAHKRADGLGFLEVSGFTGQRRRRRPA